jgi:3D (Asp-Asp-Asp) domain-containing protein
MIATIIMGMFLYPAGIPSDVIEIYEQRENNIVKEVYMGNYELTAYTWTGNPCANGNYPTSGYTVACNSLPLGTKIHIDGYGDYVVEDRGSMAGNVIDIYMDSYDACIQFGRRTAEVYVIGD